MPEPFIPCTACTDPLHCGSWSSCYRTDVGGPMEEATMASRVERVGPPMPTKRGGAMIVGGENGGPSKIIDADYAGIEQRILAKMTAINGAAEYVVERFCELSKTDSGTPLFKPKFTDGSFTPTGRLLCNLVVEAIQGEVTL